MKLNSGYNVSDKGFVSYKKRKKNQVYRMFCSREEQSDWENQLNTILIELGGLTRELPIEQEARLLMIIGKLQGLKDIEEFKDFRKTCFEIMSAIEEL